MWQNFTFLFKKVNNHPQQNQGGRTVFQAITFKDLESAIQKH